MAAPLPLIIQGGMGIGVSNWRLARAVSLRGQLGVVSGTCIDTVFVRRLQDGDGDGSVRRAIKHFPIPGVGARAVEHFFSPSGRAPGQPYKLLPLWKQHAGKAREQLTMLASFVEVHLAKQGHDGIVGMNLLTKVQLPNLATLYGAMLAGVDYVLMGAGIPKDIPGVLDALAAGNAASMRFDVEGLERGVTKELRLDPREHFDVPPRLRRPAFLPIVAAHSLAAMLARKSNGAVDGFIVEAPIAGGHNAPPRGRIEVDADGEPQYGPRDVVDLDEMRGLGKPFWLAGGTGSPERLAAALAAGAAGVQVGTLFAFADESGLDPTLKRAVLAKAHNDDVAVTTDLRASPTGFPFKVLRLEGTNSTAVEYARRTRKCDLGYLRTAYRRADGRIAFRCAAEPERDWANKGGAAEETVGRKCLCNGLMANIGLAQLRADGPERALLTSGNDIAGLRHFAADHEGYTADDVIDYLLALDRCLHPGILLQPGAIAR